MKLCIALKLDIIVTVQQMEEVSTNDLSDVDI